ncbi:hypothetical protein BDP55DRAFT_625690 [Colletotrichum godetiae]|uniref:Uncharacterized protein n=1 Tax=Colletotrichum godetiae TaxID=1209918 RepID=A0AAJ0B020_9PEZI|nr:uncharacterized protein BDP55DRAFT_625690 [Colletotrichum godetiae]KAK1701472.1 hypothetical protein BDP55DRAFT_625690 [Colletotrichum godetiae]
MLVLLVLVSLRSPLVCSLLSLTKSGCWGTGRCPPLPSGGRPGPGSRLNQGCRDGLDPVGCGAPCLMQQVCNKNEERACRVADLERYVLAIFVSLHRVDRPAGLAALVLVCILFGTRFARPPSSPIIGENAKVRCDMEGHLEHNSITVRNSGSKSFSPVSRFRIERTRLASWSQGGRGVSWIVCTTTSPKPKRRVSWRVGRQAGLVKSPGFSLPLQLAHVFRGLLQTAGAGHPPDVYQGWQVFVRAAQGAAGFEERERKMDKEERQTSSRE